MNEKDIKKRSKFLSLVLRHKPEKIGITLNKAGWTSVLELLKAVKKYGMIMKLSDLEFIVENNDKKRFAFSEDNKMIRANQGHSVEVDLKYKEVAPPNTLYHGTIGKFVRNDIIKSGLKKMNRHHVHLSDDFNTATEIGKRRGIPTVLTVNSGLMYNNGFKFYLSDNGVWLTDHVPPKYFIWPVKKVSKGKI